MSQHKDDRMMTFESDAAFDRGTRVLLKYDGTVRVANSEKSIGWSTRKVFAAGEHCTICAHRGGTGLGIASDSIAAGARVYAALNGKLASSGTISEGVAMESAEQGQIFEVMYQ